MWCVSLHPTVINTMLLQPHMITDLGNSIQSDTSDGSSPASIDGNRTISGGSELDLPCSNKNEHSDTSMWMIQWWFRSFCQREWLS